MKYYFCLLYSCFITLGVFAQSPVKMIGANVQYNINTLGYQSLPLFVIYSTGDPHSMPNYNSAFNSDYAMLGFTTALPVETAPIAVKLSPNPTTGEVFVLGDVKNCSVQVYSNTGTLLQNVNPENNSTISLVNYTSGIYLVKIQKDGQLPSIFKIIKL